MGRYNAVEAYQDSFVPGDSKGGFDASVAFENRPVVERCSDLPRNSNNNVSPSDAFYSNRTTSSQNSQSDVLVVPPCNEYPRQCREPVVIINNYNNQDEYESRYDSGWNNSRVQNACYDRRYNDNYRQQYYPYQNPYNYNQYYNQYQNPYNGQYYNQYQYYNNQYQYNNPYQYQNQYQYNNPCYQGRYYQPYYYNNCNTAGNLAGMAISMGLGIAGAAIFNHRYHHNNYNYNNNWNRYQMPFARGRHHC